LVIAGDKGTGLAEELPIEGGFNPNCMGLGIEGDF